MAEPKKVWNKYKITAIVIMLIAVAFVFMMFIEPDMTASNNPENLEKSISKLISRHGQHDVQAEIVQIDKTGNELIVSFKDGRYPDFVGIIRFQKVFHFLWKPIGGSYGNQPSIAEYSYYSYIRNDNSTLSTVKITSIIYGVDADPRISYYTGMGYYGEVLPKQNVSESNFIKYYDMEGDISELNFFDADGNNITLELYKELDHSGPNGGIWWSDEFEGIKALVSFIYFLIAFILAAVLWTRNSNPIKYYDENIREEKTSRGFADKLKNLSRLKKTALVVLVISILTICVSYSFVYSVSLSEDNLAKSIEKNTEDRNVTILKTERDGNYLLVLYKTEEPYVTSLALFERGMNGRWTLLRSVGHPDICISSFEFNYENRRYFIVTGTECDPRAVSYEYNDLHPNYEELGRIPIYSSSITEPTFIHIYRNDNYGLTMLEIYDSTGKDIRPELWKEYPRKTDLSSERETRCSGTSVISSIISYAFIINLLILWVAWVEKPKRK